MIEKSDLKVADNTISGRRIHTRTQIRNLYIFEKDNLLKKITFEQLLENLISLSILDVIWKNCPFFWNGFAQIYIK